jgi:hypothetical protein
MSSNNNRRRAWRWWWGPHIALIIAFLYATIAFVSHTFEFSDRFVSAISDESAGRIALLLLIVLFLAWQTDKSVYPNTRGKKDWAWSVIMVGFTAVLVWDVWDFRGIEPRESATVAMLFFAVLIMAGVVIWPEAKPPAENRKDAEETPGTTLDAATVPSLREKASTTDETLTSKHPIILGVKDPRVNARRELDRWRRLGSLAIMVLALFAFGLHVETTQVNGHEKATVHVNWKEVPAILIIFVLAELGVGLVVQAQNIERRVTRAANIATGAVTQAESTTRALGDAQATLDKIDRSATQIKELLNKTLPITDHSLWETLTERDLHGFLGLTSDGNKDKDQDRFWDKMHIFVNRWADATQPVSRNLGTRMLVGNLFDQFIGEGDNSDGTVHRTDEGISCITADAVFARASQQWLNSMRTHNTPDDCLIIWAVTRLLPTEFAIPPLWWNSGDTSAPRVDALNSFVRSVITTCKEEHVQYRRVTVLERQNGVSTPQALIDTPDAFDSHADINENGKRKSEDVGDLSELDDSLDNWLIWDPRTQKSEYQYAWKSIGDRTEALLGQTIGPGRGKISSPVSLSWDHIASLYQNQPEPRLGHRRILPRIGDQHEYQAYIFWTEAEDYAPGEGGEGRCFLLGASPEFLNDNSLSWEQLHPLLSPFKGLVEFAEDEHDPVEKPKRRTFLRALGWKSIREWYVEHLHTNEEAYWVVMDPEGIQRLDALQLKWAGSKVITLDLLLIGCKNNALSGRITWHGAAISNLQADRTECTIHLVTCENRLKAIEAAVLSLLTGEKPIGLKGRAPWRDWPKGSLTPVTLPESSVGRNQALPDRMDELV